MPAIISLLRGVNLGGHNQIKMDDLRTLCTRLGMQNVQTYIQSGNVVFLAKEKNKVSLARKIEDAIEKKCGFRPDVVLRIIPEIRDVIARNPFAKRRDIHPGKLIVTFLAEEPGTLMREALLALKPDPEEMHVQTRELYIYYPDGMGKSKFLPALQRALKNTGTARNWNTIMKLLEMAEALEA